MKEGEQHVMRQKMAVATETAKVYCPMCTHTVEAAIERDASAMALKRRVFVTPGQKCAHCAASLDAGYILPIGRAA